MIKVSYTRWSWYQCTCKRMMIIMSFGMILQVTVAINGLIVHHQVIYEQGESWWNYVDMGKLITWPP
jgi:hypothetical protein